MKHTKRLLTVLLMALLCAVLVLAVSAQGDVTIIASGNFGEWNEAAQNFSDNVTWTLDSEGTLTLSGEGKMYQGKNGGYGSNDVPWYAARKEIKHIIIEEGVTESFPNLISYLSSLTTVYIPASLASGIEYGFQFGGKSIERIIVDEDNPNYMTDEFGCLYRKNGLNYRMLCWIPTRSDLTSFVVPEDVNSLYVADTENDSLEHLVISKSVDNIPSAFYHFSKLQAIEVDENNPDFFSDKNGCLYEKRYDWQTQQEKITLRCFPNANEQTSFALPEGVFVGNSAFYGCQNLKTITIPFGVTNIEGFFRCYSLENVIIPDSATRIEEGAFFECRGLKNVTIPDSVTSIGEQAFAGCKNATIQIGKGVQEIDFLAFNSTKQIEVVEQNPYFSSVDGVLFNKKRTELLRYPSANASRTEYVVPSSVEKIHSATFTFNEYLKKLSFQEGVSELERMAVTDSLLLEEVSFPCSLKTIGDFNFFETATLLPKTYTIKAMDTEFGEGVFGSGGRVNIPFELREDIVLAAMGLIEPTEEIQEYLNNIDEYIEYPDVDNGELFYFGTLRCHSGSTAEAYAIEHGMDYELVHFYEGDWNYDWDNLIRWRKCIHCDERETEPLETETSGGAEIVAPADDETGFDVQPVSTDYVLIRETLGEMNVVKAFDITLKNNDGVHVQPKGTVKVKLPNDFKSESYKVYRVNPDGTYTDMNAFCEGSHLVFYTDHFSLYVIVDESAPAAPDEPPTSDEPTQPDNGSKPAKGGFVEKLFAWLIELFNMFTRWIKQ